MLPITVVIPVRNEANSIRQCIQSIGDVAEIVVADSTSADLTQAIAREMGATVLNFEWNGKYPKKRNWVLDNHTFSTDWVLFIDADERMTEAVYEAIGRAIATAHDNTAGFWMAYNTYFMGKRLRFGLTQRKLSMFRRSAGRYEKIEEQNWSNLDMEIHEHPVLSGEVGKIDDRMEHYDYKGMHNFLAKHNEYSSWEAQRYGSIRNSPDFSKNTWRQRVKYSCVNRAWFSAAYFTYDYIIRGRVLDGSVGFAYSFLKAWYFFVIFLKIRLRLIHESYDPQRRGQSR
jgi:glycosyltransferase involved in cell wall biosynthesis